MNSLYIYAIGFIAQALFSARLIVQWIKSEKAGKTLSPILFWQLSILASWMLFVYGLLCDDFAIIMGQVIAYSIYIRNLHIQNNWKSLPIITKLIAVITPIAVLLFMLKNWEFHYQQLFKNEDISTLLLLWGVAGQITFTFRFVYQWIYSERKGESCLPLGFWVISIIGSIMILSYAIYRRDPVLFLGQGFGMLVYSRNVILIRKQSHKRNH